MTERTRKPRAERQPRASRLELRAWSWVAGGLAFLSPLAALEASPKPAVDAAQGHERPVLKVRRITRLVVVHEQPAQAAVTYVYLGSAVPSSSSTSSGSSTGSTSNGGGSTSNDGGSPPVNNPPPPDPPPTTDTGGS